MKKLLFCITALLLAGAVFAQKNDDKSLAQKATDELTALYSLDAKQQADMLKIQERKYRNLNEIMPIQQSNKPLFMKKVGSIVQGNDASIRRMLTKEQFPIFQKQLFELREKKALAYKELKSAGAQPDEVEAKMAEIDLEHLK